jgi:nitroreductase
MNKEEEKISSVDRAISKIMDVPVIIAVTTKLSPEDSFREEEDYAATVCSLHNLVLSLWDMGIGSQWSTGSITRHPMTYTSLEINNEQERIVGFLKVGYPENIPEKQKKKVTEIRKILP